MNYFRLYHIPNQWILINISLSMFFAEFLAPRTGCSLLPLIFMAALHMYLFPNDTIKTFGILIIAIAFYVILAKFPIIINSSDWVYNYIAHADFVSPSQRHCCISLIKTPEKGSDFFILFKHFGLLHLLCLSGTHVSIFLSIYPRHVIGKPIWDMICILCLLIMGNFSYPTSRAIYMYVYQRYTGFRACNFSAISQITILWTLLHPGMIKPGDIISFTLTFLLISTIHTQNATSSKNLVDLRSLLSMYSLFFILSGAVAGYVSPVANLVNVLYTPIYLFLSCIGLLLHIIAPISVLLEAHDYACSIMIDSMWKIYLFYPYAFIVNKLYSQLLICGLILLGNIMAFRTNHYTKQIHDNNMGLIRPTSCT